MSPPVRSLYGMRGRAGGVNSNNGNNSGNNRRSLVRSLSDTFNEAFFGRSEEQQQQLETSYVDFKRFLEYEWRFGEVNFVQPTWRYWGEEKALGAIHTVYLKKVRYHSPSKSVNSTDSDDDISHLEWETVRVRFIKAGTLEKLVESLASDVGELESTYVNVFLATFRTFASPKQVLNLLLERYDQLRDPNSPMRESIRDQHRKTLRQALHVWLDQYPDDFREPPNFPCLSQLETFCSRVMPESELDQKVRRKSTGIRRSGDGLVGSPGGGPDPLIPSLKSSPLINQLLSTSTHSISHSSSSPDFNIKSPPSASSTSSASSSSKAHHHPHHHFTNLLPTRQSNHGVIPPYVDFLEIPEQTFAQQLTKMDYELFKRVIPHQCLGSVWSRRDKSRDRDAATVVATVDQFNAVSFRVISTVLMEPEAKSSSRAKVIAKWVDIAQELRVLKNFSSLKAIISGLQSNPVYRLKKAWSHLARDKTETFDELARIFSEDNNALAQRELLVREGTARFADTVGENDHHLQKVLQKHSENSRAISYGTIPYLGTFLTDLTMIDTAIPDTVTTEGLVNFDKRRKEFEVLAQIKLLQGAAKAYHIETQPRFSQWWDAVLILDEREAFELSCQIEPNLSNANANLFNFSSPATPTPTSESASSPCPSSGKLSENKYIKRKANSLGGFYHHRKNDSIASTGTASSSGSGPGTGQNSHGSSADKTDGSHHRMAKANSSGDILLSSGGSSVQQSSTAGSNSNSNPRTGSAISSASSNSSLPSMDASLASSSNNTTSKSEPLASSSTPAAAKSTHSSVKSLAKTSERSLSKSSLNSSPSESPYRTSEFYIIRVSIEESGPETEGVIMYKSIMIGNHERTKEVIRSAMMKHGLEGSPENYTLSQLLPNSAELLIPPTANVYYAINTQHDLNFVLREKSEDLSSVGGPVGVSATPTPGTGGMANGGAGSSSSASTDTPKGGRRTRDTSKGRRKLLGLVL